MENTANSEILRKQLKQMRIQTALIASVLVIILVVGILLAVEFVSIRASIETLTDKLNGFDVGALSRAIDSFSAAADKFSDINMDEFNSTVESLQAAADKFKSVDVDSLNSLVQSLESVATKLQNAANAITGIFGR